MMTLRILLVAALIVTGTASTSPAAEVSPPAQAVAARAAWLAYSPPPPVAGTVCLVDTGIDLHADTASSVVVRRSLDGGDPSDVDPVVKHGTRMAMLMSAPGNGVGMVGAWPALRIVSVRAASPPAAGTTQTTYRADDYRRAITLCRHESDPSAPVTVVELAIGGHAIPTAQERSGLVNEVARAHAAGISIVAGSGNDGGAVNVPAVIPGVLGVGAGDADGVFCAFSSRGSGLDLLAPGCELSTADPISLMPEASGPNSGGTSEASAFAATALAALRAYRPDLGWEAAEQLLTQTAPNGVLDLEAAFRSAGLGAIVDAGTAAMPAPAQVDGPDLSPARPVTTETSRAAMPKPRGVAARLRRGVLTVSVRGRPSQTGVHVMAVVRAKGKMRRVASTTRSANRIALRVRTRPTQVLVSYVDLSGALRPESARVTITRLKR